MLTLRLKPGVQTTRMNLSQLDTPALLIDRDKVEHNIHLALEYAGAPDRFRPHVKTHKILEVARMQVAAGIYKFKCATIAEAEMLGMAGAKDVLIAYPLQGPKVNRLLALTDKYPGTMFSALIDNLASAEHFNRVFAEAGKTARVYIDLNNGHFRTGISAASAYDLALSCESLDHVELVGLHCYDGHIRMSSLKERTVASRTAFEEVMDLRERLAEALQKRLPIVAGGSPSFSVHRTHHEVECSPGTWIFWDQRYGEEYPEQAFQKAAMVATRVISKTDAHTYCLDLGHKSIASEMTFPRVALQTPHELTQIGHSEEHLVIKTVEADVFQPGEVLLGYPYHVCPTVALYERAHVFSGGELVDEWKVIARDRKITV